MEKKITFLLSADLAEKVEEEMQRKDWTMSEVIRRAVEAYFQCDRERQNFEILRYEIIRTRAMIARVYDPQGTTMTGELLEEAGKDAMAYLEAQKEASKAA